MTSVLPIPSASHALAVSGGGDSQLILWNLSTGARIASHLFSASTSTTTTTATSSAASASAPSASAASSSADSDASAYMRYVSGLSYAPHQRLLAATVNTYEFHCFAPLRLLYLLTRGMFACICVVYLLCSCSK